MIYSDLQSPLYYRWIIQPYKLKTENFFKCIAFSNKYKTRKHTSTEATDWLWRLELTIFAVNNMKLDAFPGFLTFLTTTTQYVHHVLMYETINLHTDLVKASKIFLVK